MQTLEDADALLGLANDGCRRIVVVGGGYIGLEMAEAFIHRGCTATVVEQGTHVLGLLDRDLGERVGDAMRRHGIDVRVETPSTGFERDAVITADGPIPADLVVLGLGVAPRAHLAAEAGIELGAQRCRPRRRPPAHRASTTSGRPATAPTPPTSSPAVRCTSPSARTPTSTGGWPA